MLAPPESRDALSAQTPENPEAPERLRKEMDRLEGEYRAVRILLLAVGAILVFGALSLVVPRSVWGQRAIEIRLPAQLLFVALMVSTLLVVYLLRYESEMRKLRALAIQQALAVQSSHRASMFDSVTHVFTRSLLRELLQKEISRAERTSRPLALMMCDIDHFKHVNDRYGHLMGDDLLGQVAGVLKSCLRGSDHIVRYGGDEFLLILPETDVPGAVIVRDRIRQKMAEWDRMSRLGDVAISLSLGLYHHVPGESAEQAVAEADARMYAEKQIPQPGVPVPGAASRERL